MTDIQKADGWQVVWTCGEGRFEYYHTSEWDDAVDSYSMPPIGYHSVAVMACQDGVPFRREPAPTTIQLVRPYSKVLA